MTAPFQLDEGCRQYILLPYEEPLLDCISAGSRLDQLATGNIQATPH
ncbi:hypothetical protein [Mesorhizobium onobrychidis]|uniref:Uncharacterized protein n=1 Tax=Mesorhizobium onobrychidis TaxID=2775404 RepID=A0ABY5QTP8_9HYPH|nr:hypothetical protein [Mesorhizobium onobrychidis]UVC14388.1 hypothetical protein IHQ72_27660 [Mesorhizobium onobrychidis]